MTNDHRDASAPRGQSARFDPYTGEPLPSEGVAAPGARFDPFTGAPLTAPDPQPAYQPRIVGYDTMTGAPIYEDGSHGTPQEDAASQGPIQGVPPQASGFPPQPEQRPAQPTGYQSYYAQQASGSSATHDGGNGQTPPPGTTRAGGSAQQPPRKRSGKGPLAVLAAASVVVLVLVGFFAIRVFGVLDQFVPSGNAGNKADPYTQIDQKKYDVQDPQYDLPPFEEFQIELDKGVDLHLTYNEAEAKKSAGEEGSTDGSAPSTGSTDDGTDGDAQTDGAKTQKLA